MIRRVAGPLSIALLVSMQGCGSDDGAAGPTASAAIAPAPRVVVRGTVQGLVAGQSIVLTNAGGDPLAVSADGPFAFAMPIEATQDYRVALSSLPAGQACTVLFGRGRAATIGVGGPQVICGPASRGRFESVADAPVARLGPTLVALPDDSVLVFGGSDPLGPVREVSRFDPSNDRWTTIGALPATAIVRSAFLLPDDRVLVIASSTTSGGTIGTLRYDVATGSVSAGASAAKLTDVRYAIALRDGRMVASDGASVELYEPSNDRWTIAEAPPLAGDSAALLGDGTVLVLAPPIERYRDADNSVVLDREGATLLFDAATGRWRTAGSTVATRARPQLVTLPDGRVLAIGGTHVVGSFGRPQSDSPRDTAEVFDAALGRWAIAGTITARERSTATLMPDGRVLVAGGNVFRPPSVADTFFPVPSLDLVEAYEPGRNAWSTFGALTTTRTGHGAVRTAGGKLFVSGGKQGFLPPSPPLNVTRPVIASEVGW